MLTYISLSGCAFSSSRLELKWLLSLLLNYRRSNCTSSFLIPSECLEWLLSGSESSLQILDLRDVCLGADKGILPHTLIFAFGRSPLPHNEDSAIILGLSSRLKELYTTFQLWLSFKISHLSLSRAIAIQQTLCFAVPP
ncbi:hypothetical protein PILCRDRAFT_218822 [Piloderma croceum F 1598]|uniref:Uncharacterized protein n=1 Tax=Piloderma croceum (strain F 1598) TaxID=765440 RepID=A0A0C3BRX4_PILCF|nr:hypothetical protein PILCRDRAFT_218822 [Piloderma croceum F 1598]